MPKKSLQVLDFVVTRLRHLLILLSNGSWGGKQSGHTSPFWTKCVANSSRNSEPVLRFHSGSVRAFRRAGVRLSATAHVFILAAGASRPIRRQRAHCGCCSPRVLPSACRFRPERRDASSFVSRCPSGGARSVFVPTIGPIGGLAMSPRSSAWGASSGARAPADGAHSDGRGVRAALASDTATHQVRVTSFRGSDRAASRIVEKLPAGAPVASTTWKRFPTSVTAPRRRAPS